MQGSSSLTAFAGQTIQLTGTGSLATNNCAALLEGTGSIGAKSLTLASATLSGAGLIYAYALTVHNKVQWLPALASKGGDKKYSWASTNLPALTTEAYELGYTPAQLIYGYATLPWVTNSGYITQINPMQGGASLPAAVSLGGDFHYGEGRATLPALQGLGIYAVAHELGDLDATMPMLTGFVGDWPVLATLTGNLPSLANEGSSVVGFGTGSTMSAQMPELSGSINAGASLVNNLPVFEGEITGTYEVRATLEAQIPKLAVRINAGGQIAGSAPTVRGLIEGSVAVTGSLQTASVRLSGSCTGSAHVSGTLVGSVKTPRGTLQAIVAASGSMTVRTLYPQGALTSETIHGILDASIPVNQGSLHSATGTLGSLDIALKIPQGRLSGRAPGSTRILRHIRNEV